MEELVVMVEAAVQQEMLALLVLVLQLVGQQVVVAMLQLMVHLLLYI
jgi:hypothetical protein